MNKPNPVPSKGNAFARLVQTLQYPYIWLALPEIIRDLRERGTVTDWVEFAFHSPFVPIQFRAEIAAFIESVAALRPQAVLEVGTEGGGTLLLLTLAAAPDATVISVDLPVGRFGGYPLWKASYYRRLALPSQQLHLLRANSHALSTLQRIREILADRPLDVLFIDGDHTYGGVRIDWQMYGPLVAPKGFVGFHDIVPHPPETGCEVYAFWQELKAKFAHREIVAKSTQSWGGIGMVWPSQVGSGRFDPSQLE